jgi:hypothetical protein
MAISSIHPGNTICYIEKPKQSSQPLQSPTETNGINGIKKSSDQSQKNNIAGLSADNTANTGKPVVNTNGQTVGSLINTTA